jgi:hypothetical protein
VKCAVLALAASLGSVALGAGGPSAPRAAALDESFSLRVGESARIEAEALQIGFEGVRADSRCPRGEQCIWEGDAIVRVWLQKDSRTKETCELHTSTKKQGEVSYLGYVVRLVRLDPYPVSSRTIAPEDYVATLEVTRGSSAAPDR